MGTEQNEPEPTQQFVYYNRRYAIGLLLGLFTATNYYQHFEFTAISNIVAKYYEIEETNVHWTALVYNIGCILFLYPTLKCIERYGFKKSMIFATFFNAFGCCIKCIAYKRNWYGILLFGQIFPAFMALFPMSLPAILGANWFKSEHVAGVIGVNNMFTALGCIVAFLAPTFIFKNLTEIDDIQIALSIISAVVAAISCIIFVLTFVVVKEKPKTPPSLAQKARDGNSEKLDFKSLLKNLNYILLLVIFSFVLSVSQVTTVILNQSILTQFTDGNHILTIAGILSFVSIFPASFATGFICKICKRYKLLLIVLSALMIALFSLYTYGLWLKNEIMIYVFLFCASFVYNCLIVFVQDYIVEVTYPYPEGTTMSIATCVASIPGLGIVPLVSKLIEYVGATEANFVIIGIGVVNLLLALIVSNDLRRHSANSANDSNKNVQNGDKLQMESFDKDVDTVDKDRVLVNHNNIAGDFTNHL